MSKKRAPEPRGVDELQGEARRSRDRRDSRPWQTLRHTQPVPSDSVSLLRPFLGRFLSLRRRVHHTLAPKIVLAQSTSSCQACPHTWPRTTTGAVWKSRRATSESRVSTFQRPCSTRSRKKQFVFSDRFHGSFNAHGNTRGKRYARFRAPTSPRDRTVARAV